MTPQACQLSCPQRVSAPMPPGGRSTVMYRTMAACVVWWSKRISMLDIKPQRQTIVNGTVLRPSPEWILIEVQSA